MTLELGITQDYRKALKWYKLEAEQRYTYAQYNLSAAHGSGTRVPKDYNAPISKGSIHLQMQDQGFTKKNFEDEMALILSEEPAPGAGLTSPVDEEDA